MTDVYVIGVGSTVFGKHLERSIADLSREAVQHALKDAALAAGDIGAAYFANSSQGYFEGQHAIRGPIALRKAGLSDIPISSVENACAGGATAFNLAKLSIEAGAVEIALAAGAEKLFSDDHLKSLAGFESGVDLSDDADWRDGVRELRGGAQAPVSAKQRSRFMDIYEALCTFHMEHFASTREQMAVVAAKNSAMGASNPLAGRSKPYTVADVLNAKPVVGPLTVPMCAPLSDGASAAILASEDYVRKNRLARAVRVRASVFQTGVPRKASEMDYHVSRRAANKAFEKAGVAPEDIDIVELHDATAIGEIMQSELMGFFPFGEGGPAALRGRTSLGGELPINLSGGLISKGHPIGATGLGQIHELVLQLRGEAGSRQSDGARLALAENGGGFIGVEEAICAVHILEATNGAVAP